MLSLLGANSGSSFYNSSTLIFNRMSASTGGAGPSDVEDFDDLCQAQLAHAALLAQGVVNIFESLMFAEGAGSDGGFGAVVVEVGAGKGGFG